MPDNPASTQCPPAREGLFRRSVGLFLAMLLLLFVVAPFVEVLPGGRHLEGLLATLVLMTAVLAVGGRRRSLFAAGVLAGIVMLGLGFQQHRAEGAAYMGFMTVFLLFIAFVILRFLYFILRATRVTSEVLCAGVAVYLLLGMLWAAAYALTARLMPGAFSGLAQDVPYLRGFDALYFSMITLTTVGYGDIAPLVRPARMLAMMEAVTGTLYLAVLISRLVSLHSATPNDPSPDGKGPDSR